MQLETLLSKSRDVSQEWLDKARAGMQGMQGVERQGLIAADEVTFTAKVSEESGPDSDNSDREDPDHSSKQDFWGEIERKKTEQEVGWARLE